MCVLLWTERGNTKNKNDFSPFNHICVWEREKTSMTRERDTYIDW